MLIDIKITKIGTAEMIEMKFEHSLLFHIYFYPFWYTIVKKNAFEVDNRAILSSIFGLFFWGF